MHQIDPNMQACMDACHECHVTCLHMAMNHCLEAGGKHAEPQHMKIMMDCAQIFVASAPRFAGYAPQAAKGSTAWRSVSPRAANAPMLATR